MLKHKNVLTTWPTIRLDKGTLETVYVIETDLALTPDDPDFDQEALDSLVEAARAYMDTKPHYNSVRLERVRKE